MRRGWIWILALGAPQAWARNTGLHENHRGVTLGGGAYLAPSGSDPIPGLAPTGTTVSGSNSLKPVTFKLGYFSDIGRALTFESFLRVLFSTGGDWTTSGAAGTTSVGGWGLGTHLHVAIARGPRSKIGLRGDFEWVKETYSIRYKATNAVAEELKLGASAILLGGGLHSELWLGDLWTLAATLGYRAGLPASYSATTAGRIFGRSVGTGAVTDPKTGDTIHGRFGGFFVEAALKLSFF